MSDSQELIVPSKTNQVGMATFGAGGAIPALKDLSDVVTIATLMSRAGIGVRKHLRDNPGACFGVTMFALEINANPFAIANKSYLVNDQIAYEAQVLAAVINKRAPIKGRPIYTFDGEGPTRRCTVTVVTNDDEPQTLTYTSPMFKDIKTKNSPLWVADVDQQFCYFSIRSLTRRYFPETILGMYDREEIEAEPMTDQAPGEKSNIAAKLKAAPADTEGFKPGGVEAATATDPSQIVDGEFEEVEAEADAIDPNAAQAVREGHATPGEIYLMADETVGQDDKVQTFKDGQKFSRVLSKGMGKYAVYAKHPAKADEPATDPEVVDGLSEGGGNEGDLLAEGDIRHQLSQHEPAEAEVVAELPAAPPTDPQAAEPPPPAAEPEAPQELTLMQKAAATTVWKGEGGLHGIYGTIAASPDFKEADEEDQNEIKAVLFKEVERLNRDHGAKLDHALDPTIFALWMCSQEGQEGIDAIEGTYRTLKRTAGFEALTEAQKNTIDQRVARYAAKIKATL